MPTNWQTPTLTPDSLKQSPDPVIVGTDDGDGTWSPTDADNPLQVQIANGTATAAYRESAFGEQSVAELNPLVQLDFGHGILHPRLVTTFNNGGTTTIADSQLIVSTGAAANQQAELRSTEYVKYYPGQGAIARFTGLFTTGVAGSEQWAGIGDTGDGYFFGYKDDVFGVRRIRGGIPTIQGLSISTPSSHAENITITLDGDADATVAVTASGDATITANEIAAHDFSTLGDGWQAIAWGSLVYFISYTAEARAGAFTLSGATSAVGTFQGNTGVAPTEEFVPQTSWETLADGTGELPLMDWTKGNVFQIKYQWLGYGMVHFFVENPNTGKFVCVYRMKYANTSTVPSTNQPSFQLRVHARNTSNTSDMVVKSASLMGGKEGRIQVAGPRGGAIASQTGVDTTEVPILSVNNTTVLGTTPATIQRNRTVIQILRSSISCEHTKPVLFRFYANPALVGAVWTQANPYSLVYYDTSATSFSGGILIFGDSLAKSDSELIEALSESDAEVPPGSTFTITAQTVSGTGADVEAALNWVERF